MMEPQNIREILDIEMPKEAQTVKVITVAFEEALNRLGYTLVGMVVAHEDAFGPEGGRGGHVQTCGYDPYAAAQLLTQRYKP